jgi:hypothetical protein
MRRRVERKVRQTVVTGVDTASMQRAAGIRVGASTTLART